MNNLKDTDSLSKEKAIQRTKLRNDTDVGSEKVYKITISITFKRKIFCGGGDYAEWHVELP